MVVPTRFNEYRPIDFVSDQLAEGKRFRVLNTVDDFRRERARQLTEDYRLQ